MNERLPPDRRQFLTGKVPDPQISSDPQVASSEGPGNPVQLPSASDICPLMTYSTNAMGCQFQIITSTSGQRGIVPSIHDGFELIARLERQLTTYDSNSELEQLNQIAALQPTRVSSNLFDLLCRAKVLSEATHGAFDITAAPLSRLWNFHQRAGRVPDSNSIDVIVQQIGYRHLLLDPDNETVAYENKDLRIDLGGIGKGYALDELTQLIVDRGGADFLIHGGQSSIVARGQCEGRDGESAPWQIGLSHPLLPAKRLATVSLNNEAMGTSGSGRQSFVHNGKRYGHIIDPRCGWPVDHRLSVTVIAASAADADALATAFFVMSDEELETWVDKNPGIGVLLLRQSESAGQIVAEVFNFGARSIQWLVDDLAVHDR